MTTPPASIRSTHQLLEQIRDSLPEGQRTCIVAYSGGKDSVTGDSVIWCRIDGKVYRTTPENAQSLCDWQLISSSDGRFVVTPKVPFEILTASTNHQKTAKPHFAPISYMMYHDVDESKEILEISVRGGRSVKVTSDHSVMKCKNGSTGTIAEPSEAKTLAVDDQMFAITDYGFDGQEVDVPDWLLRLCGLWIADGCFVQNKGKPLGKMIISTGNFKPVVDFLREIPRPLNKTDLAEKMYSEIRDSHPSQASAVRAVSAALGVSDSCTVNTIYRNFPGRNTDEFVFCRVKPNGDVWLCNKQLVDRMKSLGFSGGSRTKKIPEWMFTASRRQIAIFLAGYFDGDGHLGIRGVVVDSVSRDLAFGARELLIRLGIECSFTDTTKKIGGFRHDPGILYRVNIASESGKRKFCELVPTLKSKSKIITHKTTGWKDYSLKIRQITKIRKLEPAKRRVYDFEVPGQHTFIADGLLVHNSWAILDLTHSIFGPGNIHAYNLYIVPGLECELREIRRAERRYNITIRRLPHPGMFDALRSGHLQPLPTQFRRKLHHADIYELARNITGSDWLIFGHRIDESLQRRGMIKGSQGVMQSLRKAYPLWNWKAHDVFHYLRAKGIAAPEQYTEDDTTGLTLGANSLLYLRQKYPDDYRKVLELFPLAEAQFIREKQRITAGLGPTHYSLTRKKGLMETLNEWIEKGTRTDEPASQSESEETRSQAENQSAR